MYPVWTTTDDTPILTTTLFVLRDVFLVTSNRFAVWLTDGASYNGRKFSPVGAQS